MDDSLAGNEYIRREIAMQTQREHLTYIPLTNFGKLFYSKPRGYPENLLAIEQAYSNRPGDAGHIGPLTSSSKKAGLCFLLVVSLLCSSVSLSLFPRSAYADLCPSGGANQTRSVPWEAGDSDLIPSVIFVCPPPDDPLIPVQLLGPVGSMRCTGPPGATITTRIENPGSLCCSSGVGLLDWIPTINDVGSHQFTCTATGGGVGRGSATQTITFNVVPGDTPRIAVNQSYTVLGGEKLSFLATFRDGDAIVDAGFGAGTTCPGTLLTGSGAGISDALFEWQTSRNDGGTRCVVNLFATDIGGQTGTASTELVVDTCSNSLVDSDGDALPDEWEICGLNVASDGTIEQCTNRPCDLDLAEMGADPLVKDLFVEVDFMRRGTHTRTHRPNLAAINLVVEAFKNAPVSNADGITTGINLHVDAGEKYIMNPRTGETWGARSKFDRIAHQNNLGAFDPPGDVEGEYDWTDFDNIKAAHFSRLRSPVFRYGLFAHQIGTVTNGGIAKGLPSSDFIVSLGAAANGVGTTRQQAGTFMHELGHTLGLRHGGGDHLNYKPNYLSVMNYYFGMRGLIIGSRHGHFDFSRIDLATLDEASGLDERLGLVADPSTLPFVLGYGTKRFCPGQDPKIDRPLIVLDATLPIDWNCTGSDTESTVRADINGDEFETLLLGPGSNDWQNIDFAGGSIGLLGDEVRPPREPMPEELTKEQDDLIPTPFSVSVDGPPNQALMAGDAMFYRFEVKNIGEELDSYNLEVVSEIGWVDPNLVLAPVSLGPGQSSIILIPIAVPFGSVEGAESELLFIATSIEDPHLSDEATVITTVKSSDTADHPGDLNHDGNVDALDRDVVRSSLGSCSGEDRFIVETDYNLNDCTDYEDYRVWYRHYQEYVRTQQ